MQVSDIINLPIGNRQLDKTNNPIGNREIPQSSVIVDRLLQDYADLIDPHYQKWFAKRFYYIPFNQLHRAASEARNDGKDKRRLFAHLVQKAAQAAYKSSLK